MKKSTETLRRTSISYDVTYIVKGLAVVLMLIHHLFSCFPHWVDFYGVRSTFIPLQWVINLSVMGKVCVAMYVFLSAYGMTVGMKENGREYIEKTSIKRYKKLVINFGIVYLLAICLCSLREDSLSVYAEQGKRLPYMLIDGFGLASFVGTPTYNETWWYMSLAIFLIFFTPLVVKAYDSVGICLIPVCAMITMMGSHINGTASQYMLAVSLGVFFAKSDCLAVITDKFKNKPVWIMLSLCAVVVILVYVRFKLECYYLIDALLAFGIVLFFYLLVDVCGIIFFCLRYLGKHSMNIFLIHTLIFEYFFTDFIYSFKHWILVTTALVVTSLFGSIVIEGIKWILLKGFEKIKK